jgi:hypothetical protein
MPAFVAGIHVLSCGVKKDVDGRNKSGHDETAVFSGVIAGLDPAIHHFENMDTRIKSGHDKR